MADAESAGTERAHLVRTLRRVNHLREQAPGSPEHLRAESELDARFRTSCRLAVYGTLGPGESNHDQVADLRGTWCDATVRGDYVPASRSSHGYPELRWDPEGPVVPVKLFVSFDLPDHWHRLDEFEGSGYVRILVPVELAGDPKEPGERSPVTVANLYEDR